MYHACMKDGRTPVDLHKVTVNLIPKAWEAVNETAARLGLSKTDVINRALQSYAYFDQVTADGGEVFVRSGDGNVNQVKFL
jgi:hypothetical protein